MESSDHSYEVLLQYLTPADTAALRLVNRSWQSLVDRCLTTLQPFAVTTGLFSLNSTPCLVYRSPFQHSTVRHHTLDYGPSYALHALAGQFTALHSLSIDCGSKSCHDYEALRLLRHLRRLHLAQFGFADEAFRDGLGRCRSLLVLHLDGQQAMLQVRSLRHLTGLDLLQELVLRPRGYVHVPPDSAEGLAALGQLSALTHLQLTTALKASQLGTAGDVTGAGAAPLPDPLPGELPGLAAAAGGDEGHPLYFSAAATNQLSAALGQLKGLKVLRLTGVHLLPAAVGTLTQLAELSLERVGLVDRPSVAKLSDLKQLTGLTLITAADAPGVGNAQPPPQQQQQNPLDALAAEAPAAAVGAPAAPAHAAPAAGGGEGLWLPLLKLPALQELVLGSAHRSQQLNLTGSISEHLQTGLVSAGTGAAWDTDVPAALNVYSAGQGGGAGSGCGGVAGRGSNCSMSGTAAAGCGWYLQSGQSVSAYVCPPGPWSDLAHVQAVQHVVVVRSWHSAAITTVFPCFAAAVAAFMNWPQLPASPLATAAANRSPLLSLQPGAAAVSSTAGPTAGPTMFDWHSVGWNNPAQHLQHAAATATLQHGSSSSSTDSSLPCSGCSRGAVGVFFNNPHQGCYIPSMPQVLVLALRPSLRGLDPQHRLLVAQLLQMASQQRPVQPAGGQQLFQPQQPALGNWHSQHDSLASCLLLAQLRSSLHHSKLLLVLGTSATALTRLELTVDQSWPPSVLASLGQLERLRSLVVLKIDCGRQHPADGMWEGLSRLTSLRWLCLRWLDRLPVAFLAPLTNLAVLQLKNIDQPPGVAQLAEVLHGMPHLTALAIEGSLLDAEEDWLRAVAGLMRHGRWTSSWVEHLLCREYRLRVLGSITGALLMSTLLNSPKWPEMLASALMAAVAGAIFVMAVIASLLQLLLEPQQLQRAKAWPGLPQLQHRQWLGSGNATSIHPAGAGPGASSNQSGTGHSAGSTSSSSRVGPSSASSLRAHLWGSLVAGAVWLLEHTWAALQLFTSWLGGWLAGVVLMCRSVSLQDRPSSSPGNNSSIAAAAGSSSAHSRVTWLSFLLKVAALHASIGQEHTRSLNDTSGSSNIIYNTNSSSGDGGGSSSSSSSASQIVSAPTTGPQAGGHNPGPAIHAVYHTVGSSSSGGGGGGAGSVSSSSSSSSEASSDASTTSSSSTSSNNSSSSVIVDPGNAFRRLRFLSLRRCTLSHSNNSVSNKLWQLSVLVSQLAPGLGSQLVAVGLALVLWPLAVAAAISRIAATSGSFQISSGGYSYNRHSALNVWAWGWDLICGLLQGAASRVEGAAAGCGPVVAVASCMPELRFLDATWLNLEPWELHAVVQLKQLHYLGLSRQQVGVVMSREAVFARNCNRNRRPVVARPPKVHTAGVGAGIATAAADAEVAGRSWSSWLLFPVWCLLSLPLSVWPVGALWGRLGWGRLQQQQQQASCGCDAPGFDAAFLSVDWPSLMLIESPTGFDEALEREFTV